MPPFVPLTANCLNVHICICHGCEEIYSYKEIIQLRSMNHRKIWHKWEGDPASYHPSRQVASLKAVIHFSARLSFSEQKTMLS